MKSPRGQCVFLCCGAFVASVATALIVRSPGVEAAQITPVLNCTQTEVAGKCGTDFEISIQCGDTTCVLESHVFGQITNCKGLQSGGLKNCEAKMCKETIIHMTCNEQMQCVPGNPLTTMEDVDPRSVASGAACGGGQSGGIQPH